MNSDSKKATLAHYEKQRMSNKVQEVSWGISAEMADKQTVVDKKIRSDRK